MPIYEYHCNGCGCEFEVLAKFTDPPPPCQECGGAEVHKMVSRTSFVLKGGGWYRDGYGSSSKSGGGASTSTGSKESSSSPSSSSSSGSDGGGGGGSGSTAKVAAKAAD